MAMSKAGLKTKIETEMVAQGFVLVGAYAYGSKLAEAIANAVIDEITINARCNGADSNGDTHAAVEIV